MRGVLGSDTPFPIAYRIYKEIQMYEDEIVLEADDVVEQYDDLDSESPLDFN